MSDNPFARPREIHEGKRDSEMPGFSEISAWLGRVPKTWLPALLIRIVKCCEYQKVFQKGGLEKVVASAKAAAHNPLSMLRELGQYQSNPVTPTQEQPAAPWISVETRLPEHDERVACKYEGVYSYREVTFWNDSGNHPHFGMINEPDGKGSQPATHWKYLCPPPTAAKGGG